MALRFKTSFFACHLDFTSRMIRVALGVITNIGTLLMIESLNALLFWSLILVSYVILLEAFWGIGLLHSAMVMTKDTETCKLCEKKK